jgi:hypothetical protein
MMSINISRFNGLYKEAQNACTRIVYFTTSVLTHSMYCRIVDELEIIRKEVVQRNEAAISVCLQKVRQTA